VAGGGTGAVLEEEPVSTSTDNPAVRATLALEDLTALDGPIRAIEPSVRSWFGSGTRGEVLRGDWLGHALHPVMTDMVVGSWTSATVLDLVAGRDSRKAARTLVGTGLLAFVPTAWTGWAEWSQIGQREKRVGLVHAVTNGVAAGLYAASYAARRRGQDGRGIALSLAGISVAGVGAYLGGHLAAARKVSSHDPAYDAT
jgi:hypothetical protein